MLDHRKTAVLSLAMLLASSGGGEADTSISTRAWVSGGSPLLPDPSFTFPESSSANLAGRADVGIAFSGGGSRAFVSAAGEVRALRLLGLVGRIKYAASVSGGSWFNALWQFWQSGAADEAALLGPYVPPAALNETFLRAMPEGCCLAAPGSESLWVALARLLREAKDDPAYNLDRAWLDATHEIFLAPWGVSKDAYMSWNESTVESIRARNAGNERLQAAEFALPHSADLPFPLFAGTAVAPADEPFLGKVPPCNRSYTVWQMNPLCE